MGRGQFSRNPVACQRARRRKREIRLNGGEGANDGSGHAAGPNDARHQGVPVLDVIRFPVAGHDVHLAGDDDRCLTAHRQPLRHRRQVGADFGGIDAFGADVHSGNTGDFGGVSLDDVDFDLVEQFFDFAIAQGRGACAAHVQNNRDAFLIGGRRRRFHRLDKLHRQGADVEHQRGSNARHIGDFLRRVGHDR